MIWIEQVLMAADKPCPQLQPSLVSRIYKKIRNTKYKIKETLYLLLHSTYVPAQFKPFPENKKLSYEKKYYCQCLHSNKMFHHSPLVLWLFLGNIWSRKLPWNWLILNFMQSGSEFVHFSNYSMYYFLFLFFLVHM